MPDHVLVTSRGTSGEKLKSRHYALVCRKNTSLSNENWPLLNAANLRNYGSGSALGFSQVTSVVESHEAARGKVSNYEVLFTADLAEPYYVTLVDPMEILSYGWEEVNQSWFRKGDGVKGWEAWLRTQKPGYRKIFAPSAVPNVAKHAHTCCLAGPRPISNLLEKEVSYASARSGAGDLRSNAWRVWDARDSESRGLSQNSQSQVGASVNQSRQS
ncbi:MAG TPA: hypothetical protein VGY56_20360 [Verrucomicrobiae bacterium]|nr:hypothetical protein [Verrucomicrobiae bacterium]